MTSRTTILNVAFLIFIGVFMIGCKSYPTASTEPYSADWELLKQRNPAPEWFRDAKFGIYFHWGVYSVPAFGSEWYPRWMHFKNREEYEHHIKTYGDPSEFGGFDVTVGATRVKVAPANNRYLWLTYYF